MSDNSRDKTPSTSDSTEPENKLSSAEEELRNKPEEELSSFEKQMLQTEKEMREKKPEKKTGLAAGVPTREKRETTVEEKTPIQRLNHGATYVIAAIFVTLVLMVAAVSLDSDAAPASEEVGIDGTEIIDSTEDNSSTTTDEETEE